jgi:stage IV sporulation protein FB
MRDPRASAAALSFKMGSVRVRVDPWLLLLALAVGVGVGRGVVGTAVAVASFLVTVFAHELAHAVAMRAFGGGSAMHLTVIRDTLGGRMRSMPARARALTSLAGPAASLCLGAAVLGASGAVHTAGAALEAVRYFGFVNLAWGLVNLLPIIPLDGGYVLVAVLDRFTNGRGEQPARWISILGAFALGLLAVRASALLPVVVCGLWAFQNARSLRTREDRNADAIARVHLEAAFQAAGCDDAQRVVHHCRAILGACTDRTTRRDAVRLLAYAYAMSDDWGRLTTLLQVDGALALDEAELEKLQHLASDRGRVEDAHRIGALRQ